MLLNIIVSIGCTLDFFHFHKLTGSVNMVYLLLLALLAALANKKDKAIDVVRSCTSRSLAEKQIKNYHDFVQYPT